MKPNFFSSMLTACLLMLAASVFANTAVTAEKGKFQQTTMFAHFDADQPCDIATTTGCSVFHFKIAATSQDDRGAAFQNVSVANVQDKGSSGGGMQATQRTNQRGFDQDQDQGAGILLFQATEQDGGNSAMQSDSNSMVLQEDSGGDIAFLWCANNANSTAQHVFLC